MNSRKIRENTFRVEFANLPKKPTSEEVHTFAGVHLGITRTQLVKIQMSHTDDCAFVKVTDQTIAQRIVDQYDNKFDYEVKGVKYKLRIRMADGCVDVRLHDLSENTTDQQIRKHMSCYGEVLSVQELLWSDKHYFPGFPSGIRQVRMVLREPIKSYVTIDGDTTYVTYPKQRQTCRHCGEFMHTGISCVQNKKLLVQKIGLNDRLRGSSYAGAVRGNLTGNSQTPGSSGSAGSSGTSSSSGPSGSSAASGSSGTLGSSGFALNLSGNTNTSAQDGEANLSTSSKTPLNEVTSDTTMNLTSSAQSIDPVQPEQSMAAGSGAFVMNGSLEASTTHQTPVAQVTDSATDNVVPSTTSSGAMPALLKVINIDGKGQAEKHKQDDGSTSDDSNAFTMVEKRGRGRPKKLKQ